MFCKQCGKEIPENSNFCTWCGAAQSVPETPAEALPAGAEPQPGPAQTGAEPAPELVIEPGPAPEAPPAPELTFDTVPTPVNEPAPQPQPAPQPMPLPDPVPGPAPQPANGPVNGSAGGPPPIPPTPAQPAGAAPASGGANYDMLLKIFATVCAGVTAWRALGQIPSLFGNLRVLLAYQQLVALPYALLNILAAACYVVMALALLLLAFRRTRENTEALVFGLAAGAAGTLVVRVVSVLFSTIVNLALYRYAGAIPSLLVGLVGLVFWLAVCLGGVWGILYLMKEAPAFEHLLEDPAGKFAILMDALKKGAGDVQQQASAAAASAKSAYDAHQAQQAQAAQAMQAQAQAAQAQGAGTNGAAYPAVRIQTNRSLAAYILFSIITCGIYSYYFIYTVARDVNTMCREDGEKTGGLLAFILLSMVTCGLYGLYWEYKLGNRLAANAPRYGLNFQENGTTVLMWYLVGLLLCFIGPWVAMHILIKNTNALAAAYNARNGL